MNKHQYRCWVAERARRAGPALSKARQLMRRERPDPIAIWAMDGVLRCVLTDIHPFWARWSFFREQHGIAENLTVIEGWPPEEGDPND